MIASTLSIIPILGDDGDGKIQLLKKERGLRRSLSSMVNMISEMTRTARQKSTTLVLSHCNCQEQAERLREAIMKQCNSLKEVVVVSMGALSSMYAGDGGIVVSFCQGALNER